MTYRCCCRKFLDTPKEFNDHLQNCSEAWEFLKVLKQLREEETKLNDGSLFAFAENYK